MLLLHDRWGTPPAEPGTPEYNGYTSGTEEEYDVATTCFASAEHAMRDMLCLFKAVDPSKLSDPGPQLQRVLAFKKKIERDQLYKEFDRIEGFRDELRAKLAEWLRHHESGDEGDVTPPVAPPPRDSAPDARDSSTAGARDTEDLIDQARRLADDGKRLEAEALFARAIARGDEFNAFIAYGQFLGRVGRLAQAEAMYERALELADLSDDDAMRAVAYGNLGNVLQTRGDLDGAEAMYRKALEIGERLGRQEGIAFQYGNLGTVLQTLGDLDGARDLWRRSHDLFERIGAVPMAERVAGWLDGLDEGEAVSDE